MGGWWDFATWERFCGVQPWFREVENDLHDGFYGPAKDEQVKRTRHDAERVCPVRQSVPLPRRATQTQLLLNRRSGAFRCILTWRRDGAGNDTPRLGLSLGDKLEESV